MNSNQFQLSSCVEDQEAMCLVNVEVWWHCVVCYFVQLHINNAVYLCEKIQSNKTPRKMRLHSKPTNNAIDFSWPLSYARGIKISDGIAIDSGVPEGKVLAVSLSAPFWQRAILLLYQFFKLS